MYQQAFIVNGKFLGTTMRGPVPVHEVVVPPQSYAFFCPCCGEVWARCPVVLPDGSTNRFQIWTVACAKHVDFERLLAPGSLLITWDKHFTNNLPEEVIKYEFNLALSQYEASQ